MNLWDRLELRLSWWAGWKIVLMMLGIMVPLVLLFDMAFMNQPVGKTSMPTMVKSYALFSFLGVGAVITAVIVVVYIIDAFQLFPKGKRLATFLGIVAFGMPFWTFIKINKYMHMGFVPESASNKALMLMAYPIFGLLALVLFRQLRFRPTDGVGRAIAMFSLLVAMTIYVNGLKSNTLGSSFFDPEGTCVMQSAQIIEAGTPITATISCGFQSFPYTIPQRSFLEAEMVESAVANKMAKRLVFCFYRRSDGTGGCVEPTE